MPAKIIDLSRKKLCFPQEWLDAVAGCLLAGGVVIFPTDTVYGMGTNAYRHSSRQRIFRIKRRPFQNPLPLLIPEDFYLPLLVERIPPRFARFQKFWPGALTLLFSPSPLGKKLVEDSPKIGLRVPAGRIVRKILKEIHIPLATTSVNISGDETLLSSTEIVRRFRSSVDLIILAPEGNGIESTVVDLTVNPPRLVRRGGLITKLKKQGLPSNQ